MDERKRYVMTVPTRLFHEAHGICGDLGILAGGGLYPHSDLRRGIVGLTADPVQIIALRRLLEPAGIAITEAPETSVAPKRKPPTKRRT